MSTTIQYRYRHRNPTKAYLTQIFNEYDYGHTKVHICKWNNISYPTLMKYVKMRNNNELVFDDEGYLIYNRTYTAKTKKQYLDLSGDYVKQL